jgi:hypothetical protein
LNSPLWIEAISEREIAKRPTDINGVGVKVIVGGGENTNSLILLVEDVNVNSFWITHNCGC